MQSCGILKIPDRSHGPTGISMTDISQLDPFGIGTFYTITNAPTGVVISGTITRTLLPATTIPSDGNPAPSADNVSANVTVQPPAVHTSPFPVYTIMPGDGSDFWSTSHMPDSFNIEQNGGNTSGAGSDLGP